MKSSARAFLQFFGCVLLLGLMLSHPPVRGQGSPGQALRFDGVNDNVTFGNPSALRLSTFTIELWFRRDGAGTTTSTGGVTAVPLVAKGRSESEGNTRDTNYFLGIDNAKRVLVADFEDRAGGANHPVTGTTPICDGIWYHAAATYDGTNWRLYLNGALDATLAVGAFTPRNDSIQHASIGSALTSTGAAAGFFNGAIDEARIWNGARSAADIQGSMGTAIASAPGLVGRWGLDEGTGTAAANSAGSGGAGTIRNGAQWVAGSPFTPASATNSAIDFGGASDYVSFGAAPGFGSSTFTLEAWFRREGAGVTTSTGTGGLTAVPLVTKGRSEADGSNRDMNYFLGIDAAGHLAADFEESAGGPNPGLNHPIVGSTAVSNDVWYHAAATYDGTTWRLYLNGNLDGELLVNRSPRADSIQHAAIGTALNSTGAASGFFNGTMDDVRIWSRARSQQEISAGMSEPPGGTGLVGRWTFDNACGLATDTSGAGRHGALFGSAWKWVAGAPAVTGNQAPIVDAGPDAAITLPSTADLAGTVSDADGPEPPVSTWSKVSGPGTVAFTDAGALATSASFSTAGTYVLRLSATDGASSASDQVTIQVSPVPPVNQAPSVDAGANSSVTLPGSAALAGLITDDGLPGAGITIEWSVANGPGVVTFGDAASASTTASFSAAGTYTLTLTAGDGALTSSDSLTVTVTAAPTNLAIRFTGAGSYVTFGAAPSLGAASFTIEAWVRRLGAGQTTSTGSGGVTAVPLISKGRSENDGSNRDMNYFLGINAAGRLAADFEEGAGSASPGLNHPVTGATTLANDTWYHVAATYDGATWRLYVNGAPDGQLAVDRAPRSDSIQHAGIGTAMTSTGAAAGAFDGVIDEVRIWNVARTASQIAGGMNQEIASATGLVGRWGLNDTTGTTASNSAGSASGALVGSGWSRVDGAPFSANGAPEILTLNGPLNGATGVVAPPLLDVSVGDPDAQNLTVTFFGRALPPAAPDFTLVAIPDTQHYVDSSFYQTFTRQTEWIVANRNALNIKFVTHLGDIVQNIDRVPLEWERADVSMRVLDVAGIPNNVSPGNHDISAAGVAQYYDLYFPVARYSGNSWYGGWLGQEAGDVNRENKDNFELFSVGSLDFLIIHLEMDIPNYSLAWADKILKRYPNRRAILSTHIYLDTTATRRTSPQFRSNGTSAEQVWQQLVRPNCNVFLFVNGHYHGEAMRTDLNSCSQPVHQIVSDYQDGPNGGDGWLRYYSFKPSQNKIEAFTFSPTRNGGAGDFQTDANSRFTLDYAMNGTPFTTLGTASGIASGSRATLPWSGLAANTRYEWYVVVSDGQTTTTGPTWTFTTR